MKHDNSLDAGNSGIWERQSEAFGDRQPDFCERAHHSPSDRGSDDVRDEDDSIVSTHKHTCAATEHQHMQNKRHNTSPVETPTEAFASTSIVYMANNAHYCMHKHMDAIRKGTKKNTRKVAQKSPYRQLTPSALTIRSLVCVLFATELTLCRDTSNRLLLLFYLLALPIVFILIIRLCSVLIFCFTFFRLLLSLSLCLFLAPSPPSIRSVRFGSVSLVAVLVFICLLRYVFV